VEVIDGLILKKMFIKGAQVLSQHSTEIDALNVFPVPDGDTGTNMKLTINTAIKELLNVDSRSTRVVAAKIAEGSLMGARGNSGVILSQIFRGFALGTANKDQLTTRDFALCLLEGSKTAYKAVMRPVEGTVLTVAKNAAKAAMESDKKNFVELLEVVLEAAEDTLEKTPEMLSVLKEAGVVDAGGKGLCYLYEGFLRASKGEPVEEEVLAKPAIDKEAVKSGFSPAVETGESTEIPFAYCTEFIIKGSRLNPEDIKIKLEELGDSMLVVGDASVVKVHIHTNHPGIVLEKCLQDGSLHELKIDNMRDQHQSLLLEENEIEKKEWQKSSLQKTTNNEVAVISVANGDGLIDIFYSFGVDKVIRGGQTMNPSTEDFLQAINELQAQKVIILPNNKNVIMAANQVVPLVKGEEVRVIPSKSIPEGLAALLQYNHEESDIEQLARQMESALKGVKTGEVTVAVRGSRYNGQKIKAGQIIGLVDGKLKLVGENLEKVVHDLINLMVEPEHEVVTLYYGEEVSEKEAQLLLEELQKHFTELDVEVYAGGQPLYPYIISVE
jgi:DAK2 domain fusion protein YloV